MYTVLINRLPLSEGSRSSWRVCYRADMKDKTSLKNRSFYGFFSCYVIDIEL